MPEPTRPRRPIQAMHKGPGPVYMLNGVTGYNDHCNTKRRLPAYSMAGRGKQFSDECSPGPKYAIEPGMTRTGADGAPKVGISGRHKDLTSYTTPSPAAYGRNDKHLRSAPAYSLVGARHDPLKNDKTPAANTYSLPTTLGDKLVDKKTLPCYSLRSRPAQGGFSEDLQRTPGPGAYKVTEPSAYKTRAPGYTMIGRNEVPGDTTTKPGPGAHKPDINSSRKSAPAFSFGSYHSQYMAPMIDNVSED
jgi:hypothetical protein